MQRFFGIAIPSVLILAMMLACGRPSSSNDAPEPTREAAPTFTPIPTATVPEPTQAVDAVPTLPSRSSTTEIILVPTATSSPVEPTQVVESTDAPAATTTPIPTDVPIGATALDVANLRGGPSTEFPIVGSTVAGQPLVIVARNPAGDWYQLGDGSWIAAFLVVGAPSDVAVVDVPVSAPVAAPLVEQPVTESVSPTNPPFTCNGGCAEPPDPSCRIKGNFNGSGGDQIFHQPDGRWYDITDIVPAEGDVWFCTAEEARAAGYREAGK